MKKKIAVLAFVAAAMGASMPSWAFKSVSITTVTAQTTTVGTKTANFALAVRNTSNPLGADITPLVVNWTNIDPSTLGANTYRIADQLLVINSTVTDANGGIKIYTDNTSLVDASPRFVDPTPGPLVANLINSDSFAAGLLKGASGTTSEPPLDMAWSIKTSSKVVELNDAARGIGAINPNGTGSGFNTPAQWFGMTDAYNWTNGVDFNGDGDTSDNPGDANPQALDSLFVTMIKPAGAHIIKVGTFEAQNAAKRTFVYLEANFGNAGALQTYKTSTLRVEAYLE